MNDSRLYTIDVDGKPIAIMTASAWEELQAIGYEDWFLADLSLHLSKGRPLAGAESILRTRCCSAGETAAFERYQANRNAQKDELILLFLVAIDDPDEAFDHVADDVGRSFSCRSAKRRTTFLKLPNPIVKRLHGI
jgi:hypothetical protein